MAIFAIYCHDISLALVTPALLMQNITTLPNPAISDRQLLKTAKLFVLCVPT
ncbi:hypothetical protein NIES4074_03370 [Cylindrospermum sp. NIES-4074]|nr:hypothetical protein NIES4074_03370 [Cylindrospermum sp. NIES-4074]